MSKTVRQFTYRTGKRPKKASFDWDVFLREAAGRILDSDDLPSEVRDAAFGDASAAHDLGYSVQTAATWPEALSGRQLVFWPEVRPGPSATVRNARRKSLLSANAARDGGEVCFGDAALYYGLWPHPTVIVSDGPYGLSSFPGDPPTPEGLADWYRPHAQAWYEHSLPSTTLWFWNSEQGWANCHRMLEDCGWEFRNCHIWDKGISHIAGNCNTQTIRKYPVVTEVCVQYVRKNMLVSGGKALPLREWLRAEWTRSGLPLCKTNAACGVVDAATRKYFTRDHLWYFPPSDAFLKLAAYANDNGIPTDKPYFSKDDGLPFSADEWELMRAKFTCEVGVSNVWHENAVRGAERLKNGTAIIHMNQKPLALLAQIIRSTSDPNDVVWEPFGGLCSASVAAIREGRVPFAAEINEKFFNLASERIANEREKHH